MSAHALSSFRIWWRRLLRRPVPLSEARIRVTESSWFDGEDVVRVSTDEQHEGRTYLYPSRETVVAELEGLRDGHRTMEAAYRLHGQRAEALSASIIASVADNALHYLKDRHYCTRCSCADCRFERGETK